jgi:hypothetical protein
MRSGSDYDFTMPKLIRPRDEFPTPLFKIVLPLLILAAVALVIWLLVR